MTRDEVLQYVADTKQAIARLRKNNPEWFKTNDMIQGIEEMVSIIEELQNKVDELQEG